MRKSDRVLPKLENKNYFSKKEYHPFQIFIITNMQEINSILIETKMASFLGIIMKSYTIILCISDHKSKKYERTLEIKSGIKKLYLV